MGILLNECCNDTMGKMDNNSVDMVLTSPPYFNAKDYSQYKTVQDYMLQMRTIFTNVYNILKESRMCIINISPVLVKRENRNKQSYRIPLPFYYVPMMEEIGFEFLEDIIWEKPEGSVPNRNGSFYRHRKPVAYKPNIVTEYILVFKKPAPFLIDKVIKKESLILDGYERTNIWRMQPENRSWHPAPFPEKLVENCIRYYSYEGDTIYDPFAGSGTVGKVSERLGRKWIMSELNFNYFEKIKLSI